MAHTAMEIRGASRPVHAAVGCGSGSRPGSRGRRWWAGTGLGRAAPSPPPAPPTPRAALEGVGAGQTPRCECVVESQDQGSIQGPVGGVWTSVDHSRRGDVGGTPPLYPGHPPSIEPCPGGGGGGGRHRTQPTQPPRTPCPNNLAGPFCWKCPNSLADGKQT